MEQVSWASHVGDLGLQLGVDKTEAVVFKDQYGPADLRLRIGDQTIQLCTSLKYLGGRTREQEDLVRGAQSGRG